MSRTIFVLNCGSSSVKYSLFRDSKLLSRGIEDRIGLKGASKDHKQAIHKIFSLIMDQKILASLDDINIIGHRVVHGGSEFIHPTIVDSKVLKVLRQYSNLAPLHNPPNILGIEACMELLPKIKNIAVFDTEFYADLPEEAIVYPIPFRFYKAHGIRRYGFHGISHEYVAEETVKIIGHKIDRLITCHLGAGSSITAIYKGKPVDTSMGFSPMEGLVMTTRCGSIDPGISFYLCSELGYSMDEVERLLNFESGFYGISKEKDFREVIRKKDTDKLAKLAYDIFVRSIVKHIGGYISLLGGLDVLVFTAGIGEGSEVLRADVVRHFSYLPLSIDPEKNRRQEIDISGLGSKIKILRISTDEDLMIARAVGKIN